MNPCGSGAFAPQMAHLGRVSCLVPLLLAACSPSGEPRSATQLIVGEANVESAAMSDSLEPSLTEEPVRTPVRTKGTVVPSQLPAAILSSVALVVREDPQADSPVLFESRDRRDLEAVAEVAVALELEAGVSGVFRRHHCACFGSPAIFLEQERGEPLVLTNHHARSVRFTLWDSDAWIADEARWAQWFSERGMDGPEADVDRRRSR